MIEYIIFSYGVILVLIGGWRGTSNMKKNETIVLSIAPISFPMMILFIMMSAISGKGFEDDNIHKG